MSKKKNYYLKTNLATKINEKKNVKFLSKKQEKKKQK